MDLHEIWQENKRWILSCVAGLLVFWIALSIIAGIYESKAVGGSIRSALSAIAAKQYRIPQLRDARDNHRQIQATFDELQGAMHLPVPEGFQVPPSRPWCLHCRTWPQGPSSKWMATSRPPIP